MKLKLQHRLILSYFALALFVIGLISFLIDYNVKRGFENYIIEQHNNVVSDMIINIEHVYDIEGYDLNVIEHIGIDAIEKGLIITLRGNNNQIIWSATDHNAGLCEAMITNVKTNMFEYYTNWDGSYTEDSYVLTGKTGTIGSLTVGYLGPFYFNEEELYFLSYINQLLFLVGGISLIFSIIIGLVISRSVTKPISSVVNYLKHIHDVNPNTSLTGINNTVELIELYQAVTSLENQINEQEQLRKQLTQDMAHELKTPLTSIQGQLEAMIDGIFEANNERLESCYEEIIRIKSLITEIESLSAIENANTALQYETFDFKNLIQLIFKNFESEFLSSKIHSNIIEGRNYQSQPYAEFHGDSNKLSQAFINLTSNAIKYAGQGCTITITLDIDKDDYLIHFEDNGIGIPEKDRPYIFERFYRVDSSRTGRNGLGIGLTLVRSIFSKHGGTITLDSNHNTGTRYTIRIPLK